MSDIVFCRTWYNVDVPKLYNPVTSLLLAPELKTAWKGMKTLGELKREKNIRNEAQADSLYTVSKVSRYWIIIIHTSIVFTA